MRTIALLLVCCPYMAGQSRAGAESTRSLLEKVRNGPITVEVVAALKARADDPQVIPALRDAFALARVSGAVLSEPGVFGMHASQFLAITLSGLGVSDDAFIEELAKIPRVAIDADPPVAYLNNADGKMDPKAGHNPSFDAWCAKRNLDFAPCLSLFISYTMDIEWLGVATDRRAIPVLRQVLGMSNASMVIVAVIGLARLNDTASLPLIAQSGLRFSPLEAELIVISALDYTDPAVEGLFNRFISNPEKREKVMTDWRARHQSAPAPNRKQ